MRRRLSLFVNGFIAVFALLAWIWMTFTIDRHGDLSAQDFESLRYFTVWSNLLQAAVSALWAIQLIGLCRGKHGPSRWLIRFKFVANASVALTFFTALCFLGPVFGFGNLYVGSNFWFHLVLPVLAMLDYWLLDREGDHGFVDTLWAVLPMLAYAALYIGNLAVNGLGHGAETNDWYSFAIYGPRPLFAVFAGLLVANWMIALLMLLRRRRGDKR